MDAFDSVLDDIVSLSKLTQKSLSSTAMLPSDSPEDYDADSNPQSISLKDSTIPDGCEIKLVPVSVIPEKYQPIFSYFPYFNIVQSTVFQDVFYTDKPLVVTAPTGSGKTVIFELAVVRLLMQIVNTGDFLSNYKIVYMAPMKSLCNERFDDWESKFSPLGARCVQLTGDSEIENYFELQKYSIIFTTPEKWDSLTRRWRDNKNLVQMVKLLMIDEIHLLNEEERGATIEAVLSRMKTIRAALCRDSHGKQQPVHNLRFIALSATFSNAKDVAEWLSSPDAVGVTHKLKETLRPVNLKKVVVGYNCPENFSEFRFDLMLSYKLSNIISFYSENKPTLVFCATRKSVVQTAAILCKDSKFVYGSDHKKILINSANSLHDNKLRECLLTGIGFHHAGLDFSDRRIIEELFLASDLPVLISTGTLAMGVNFPAHLVVVKSTAQYSSGHYVEYSETQLFQMIGRAGRPQFDSAATAVIMTKWSLKAKYESLVNGTQVIESSLHKHITEHLNAEVVLKTITDVSIAMEWMKSTFLYIRSFRNPKHYGFFGELPKEKVERKLQDICIRELNGLAKYKLIFMDNDCFELKPTGSGMLMAKYYLSFETMKLFSSLGEGESVSDLLAVISSCKEFDDIQLRTNEKRCLNDLNQNRQKSTIRFPFPGKIKTKAMKINCLTQSAFGCMTVSDPSLSQDISKIFRNGIRISKCLEEYLNLEKKGFTSTLNATILSKCFKARLWENSKYVSRQIERIGLTLSSVLVTAGITSFDKIQTTNPREIELILNRNPPFGSHVIDAVVHLPLYEIEIEQTPVFSASIAHLSIAIYMTNYKTVADKPTAPENHSCRLIIGDDDNKVVLNQKIMDMSLLKTGTWTGRVEVLKANNGSQLSVNLISSAFVGLDITRSYKPLYMQQKEIPEIPRSAINEVKSSSTGNTRNCKHKCSNKLLCSHDCCKVGVKINESSVSTPKMNKFLHELHDRSNSIAPTKRIKIAQGRLFGVVNNIEKENYENLDVSKDDGALSATKTKPRAVTVYNNLHALSDNTDHLDDDTSLFEKETQSIVDWEAAFFDDVMLEEHEILDLNDSSVMEFRKEHVETKMINTKSKEKITYDMDFNQDYLRMEPLPRHFEEVLPPEPKEEPVKAFNENNFAQRNMITPPGTKNSFEFPWTLKKLSKFYPDRVMSEEEWNDEAAAKDSLKKCVDILTAELFSL